jgi:hypothetical protein
MIDMLAATLMMAGPLLVALLLWAAWALLIVALAPLLFAGILVYCWLTGQRFRWNN